MFYLIEFSGNSRGIYSSKCIQRKEGTLCIVKHKGGKYEGNIISVNESRSELEKRIDVVDISNDKELLMHPHYVGGNTTTDVQYVSSPSNSLNSNVIILSDNLLNAPLDVLAGEISNTKLQLSASYECFPENFCPTLTEIEEQNINNVQTEMQHNEGITGSNDEILNSDQCTLELESHHLSESETSESRNEVGKMKIDVMDTSNDSELLMNFPYVGRKAAGIQYVSTPTNPLNNVIISPDYLLNASLELTAGEISISELQLPSESSEYSPTFSGMKEKDLNNAATEMQHNEGITGSNDKILNADQRTLDLEPQHLSEAEASITDHELSSTINVPGLIPCNEDLMFINKSRGRNGDKKANFCIFCHTKQMKISRHLELKHKNEEEVKKFINLPKGNLERRKLIDVIRKQGNYLFNTDKNFNDGELIVCRRPKNNEQKTAYEYKACGKCKAYFSKNSIRAHFSKCAKISSTKNRVVKIMSNRVMGRIHQKACEVVRKQLFPPLREDEVTRTVRYDELVIVYANKMVEKYRNPRHHEMIRQRIRLIGRFLCTIKKMNNGISDLMSVFDPKYIDDTIASINIEAKINKTSNNYETPTVAFSLGSLLKQIGKILINESIKKHDDDTRKNTENFLKLLEEEITMGINRTVAESQFQEQRRKIVKLPTMEDVKCLNSFLLRERNKAFEKLKKKFSQSSWLRLAQTTLVHIQLFNRRRAGEVERILIDDFSCYHGIETADEDLFKSLSVESKEVARKYVRFVIRGKLNRNVPVLLDQSLLECVKLILHYREQAGVSKKNPYVFGIASQDKTNKYLRACALLRQFSAECGAKNTDRLTGTKLRKHIATTCISLNLSETEISDLANFMGHREQIHKNFYRQPLVNREILQMSKLLEVAQGATNDASSDSGEDMDEEFHQTADSSASEEEYVPRKRSTSPYGSVKRVRWTEAEKNIVFKEFGENIKRRKLPSLGDIQIVIQNNRLLRNRTCAQIKTWIHNQYKHL